MPQTSPNKRRTRQLKRKGSLAFRALKQEQMARLKTHTFLLSVLAQLGGEVTITKGTFDQVVATMETTGYSIVKGNQEGEVIVRLMVQDSAPAIDAPQELPNGSTIVYTGDGEPVTLEAPVV